MTATVEPSADLERTNSARWGVGWLVLVAVTLVVGSLVVGWLVWGSDSDSTADLVRADGKGLTEEDRQMASMLDQYIEAMRTGDFEAATSLLAGVVLWESGFEIPASDLTPSLFEEQMRVSDVFDIEIVGEDTIVFFSRNGDDTIVNVVRFGDFSLGERHIEQHLIASA